MSEAVKTNEREPKGQIRYVGFDKDGTLMDSMASYTNLWGQILNSDFGVDRNQAEKIFVETAGQPTARQVGLVLSQNGISLSEEEIFQEANKIATLLGEKANSQPFSDVKEVLKKLKEEGYKIFVSSGQQERIIQKDLERTGLIGFIDFYAGIKPEEPDYKKGAPHFRAAANHFGIPFETFVKETVFIGDTPTDVLVSKESNIVSIVRKGVNSDDRLLEQGARFVVNDFSNLPELVASI